MRDSEGLYPGDYLSGQSSCSVVNKLMSVSGRQSKILVVDDDLLMRKSIASVLRNSGYEVTAAENGQDALAMFETEKPDVMLLDLRMPKMDGIQVLSALGEKVRERPVIIVSGAGSLDDAVSALKLGAWDYLVKPIDDAVLEHAVGRVLERLSLLEENRRYQLYLEEEVEKRTAELHRARKMEAIGTLAGGIAHDFNNILSVMIGYCEMAMDQLPRDSRVVRDLKRALAAGNRATDLVKQILVFSRQAEQELRSVKAQYLLKELVKFIEASFPATIKVEASIDLDCGPILADPAQLQQVVMNLCVNARHAMSESGGTLGIEMTQVDGLPEGLVLDRGGAGAGQYIKISVSDTGHGIGEELRHRIFDPFFTTRRMGECSGLGLSVVHGIVRKLNGNIVVKSEEGRGAEFQLFFPVSEEVPPQNGEGADLLVPGNNERVMVVDDEVDVSEMLGRMLADLGYRVTTFVDSGEALRHFTGNAADYDLVVTDMTMPGLTGRELAVEMMSIRPGIPIVLCTGFSEQMDAEQAKSLGIQEFVMKPVGRKELARIVRRVLDNG